MLHWILMWHGAGPSVTASATVVEIAFRAALAMVGGWLLARWFGSYAIGWLRGRFGESIKGHSAELLRIQQHKRATPTMGGLFVVAAWLTGVAALADLGCPEMWLAAGLVLGLTGLGAVDDLIKLRTARHGLSARTKLAVQFIIAGVVAVGLDFLTHHTAGGSQLPRAPFSGGAIHLGGFYIPFVMLVLVASSNAVNLTDGLDGLAGGCLVCAFVAYGLIALIGGLLVWPISGGPLDLATAEVAVLAFAAAGTMIGFLRFNRHPARVFMGDTGSLPLGGLLGLLAVLTRRELLLPLIGGVFFVETLSVMAQVACFRTTGRRLLKCAPLHHHFQLRGWAESAIVKRFCFAAAICAMVGLAVIVTGEGAARMTHRPPTSELGGMTAPDTVRPRKHRQEALASRPFKREQAPSRRPILAKQVASR